MTTPSRKDPTMIAFIRAARTWLLESAGLDPDAISSRERVIPVTQGGSGPHPATRPYATVQLLSVGQELGTPEISTTVAGIHLRGLFQGVLRVNVYGPGGAEWLQRAAMRAEFAPEPLAVDPITGVQNISALMSGQNEIEEAHTQDYRIQYSLDLEPAFAIPAVEAQTVNLETNGTDVLVTLP